MVELKKDNIVHQIEYYFGDYNLPRDKFMCRTLEEHSGWFPLETLLTFRRLASLTQDPLEIVDALEESKLVQVNEEKTKIRRNPDLPLPEFTDDRKKELTTRTAYVKGFPLTTELDEILKFLETYGPVTSCYRRTDKTRKFKGSCFITFETKELCETFISSESVKFGSDSPQDLIRKWQQTYWDEKREKFTKYIEEKKQKKQAKLEEGKKQFDLPKGAILHFSGIPEGAELTRELIKEKLRQIDDAGELQIAFVDFNKGDQEGYVRFSVENAAKDLLGKIPDGKLTFDNTLTTVTLSFKCLDGVEEEAFLTKSVVALMELRNKKLKGRKRKGGPQPPNSKVKKTEAAVGEEGQEDGD